MSTLHTVNKSPFETQSLSSCLAHALEGSAVLMLEDGVYGAMAGASNAGALSDAMTRCKVYALEADVKAREDWTHNGSLMGSNLLTMQVL